MRRPALWVGLAAGLWLASALAFGSGYEQRLLALAAAYALMAIGYQLVFGQAGGLSLAQGACFAIGAYVAALLSTRAGWPLWAELPAAVLLPAGLAALAHLPVRRLEGHYFALATLGLAVLVRLVAVDAGGLTGGANGLAGIPPLPWGPRGPGVALFCWGLVGIGAVLTLWLKGRANGPVLALVRGDAALARVSGLDPERIRARGFVLAAGFAGAGGALHAHVLGVVSPDTAEFSVMVGCLAITVIGGRGSVAGAVLGALLLGHLPEWLRPLGQSYRVAYGLGLFLCLLLAPAGLVGSLERLRPRAMPAAGDAPDPAPPRAAETLDLAELRKSYGGVRVLDGVSLTVRPGEIVGLIGPNGSGKTTLINLASGLDRPDGGTIRLGGRRLDGLPADGIARAGVARSFQSAVLPAGMAPDEPVMAALAARAGAAGFGRAPAVQRIEVEAARLLAMTGHADLARALALDPSVLLLDEPAAGLDAAERRRLQRVLRGLAEAGRGVLVVEHDMAFLLGLADRVAVLLDGRIGFEGPAEAVRADPAVRAAYLGDA